MESRKTFADLPELDFNIVKDKDWAQSMWRRLNSGLEKTFLAWITIVSLLSDKTDDINGWVKIFEENFEDTCCELVSDMEHLRSSVIRKIEELLRTIQQHCKTLQIEMPEFGNEKLGLFQEKLLLQKRIDEYELVINRRKGELDRLRHKQLELCQYLGKEPKIIQDEPLPSEEEVALLQKHVEQLEQERFNRTETFYEMKQTILDFIAELKYKPSTEFEKGVINSDDFKVSNDNMKLLARFHKNLKEQLKDMKEEIDQLWHKIKNLWDVLDIALLDREQFKQTNKDTSIDTLENLRKELARCQDMKKANIRVFITKLRDELDNLWEKCHCKKEEGISKFGFYTSDCYTEDLLELYEIEIEKWKGYYAENNKIIKLLTKHHTLWLKLKQFEEMSGNPDRLNNRGGQLLKEEKERNMLAKKIPSIEESLVSMANEYETRHGIPFRTFGLTILEYFENLHGERENAKKEKSSARKLHNTQTPVSCGKSKATLFTPTSSTNSKRKLTPKTSSAQKKMKLTSTEVSTEPTRRKLVIPKITVTTTTLTKRRSVERRQRLEKKRRSARHLNNDGNATEYGDFQNELSRRNDCRSTLHPMSFPVVMGDSTPRKLTPRIPFSTESRPRTPSNIKTTPSSSRTPNKLTTTKSNLKLIF